jgi:hypothetical protein
MSALTPIANWNNLYALMFGRKNRETLRKNIQGNYNDALGGRMDLCQ